MPDTPPLSRRPIKARETRWAAAVTRLLVRAGIRPNTISVFSVIFAALSGACLYASPRFDRVLDPILLVSAGVLIQFRLLCNLFDGMVAVEGGMKSKSGEIFNDLPDRLADPFILIGAGYAVKSVAWAVELGWGAALLAVMTAYVRLLGKSAGAPEDFGGPMAKPHRMALMTLACLAAAVERPLHGSDFALIGALGAIILGCLVTVARRARRAVRELEAK